MTTALLFLLLTTPPALASLKIVGIGDSYVSGNGARDGSGNINYEGISACYRSPTAWGKQVADRIGGTFLNRGCSDGLIADVTVPRDMGVSTGAVNGVCPATTYPPEEFYQLDSGTCRQKLTAQIDWIDSTTDLVLLGLGGNDLKFEDIVRSCFVYGQRDRANCVANMDFVTNTLAAFQTAMTQLMLAIEAKLNNKAKIVLMSYPHITLNMAYDNNCCGFSGDNWDIVNALRALGNSVQATQLAAVTAANNAAGRQFAHLFDQAKTLFEGHEPHPKAFDTNSDGWIHECVQSQQQDSYHLNPIGHTQMAIAVDAFVKQLLGIATPFPTAQPPAPTLPPTLAPVAPTPPPTFETPTALPPTVDPDTDGGGFCFSETATAQVEHRADPVAMKDLRIGDRVLTNHRTFQPIYAFGHRHETQPAPFVRIQTSNGDSSLELSPEHLVIVRGMNGPMRADSVKAGDYLLHIARERQPEWVSVTRIGIVKREGVYAPLTADGTIVVDGVLASNYIAFQYTPNAYVAIAGHQMTLLLADAAHLYLSPLRVACQTLSNKLCHRQNHEGMLEYVAMGMDLVHWGEQQHMAVQFTLFLLWLWVACGIYAFELLLLGPGYGRPLLLLAGSFATWKVVAKGSMRRSGNLKPAHAAKKHQ